MKKLSPAQIKKFQKIIYGYYTKHRRDLPWRYNITPYRIVVSEIMLQQTQADRAIPKFNEFIKHFPTFAALAQAPLNDVLKVWQGLGYNRRALALKKIAEIIAKKYRNTRLPDDPNEWVTYPGIGPATAASIVVYAYNKPYPFIETNVRSVYIHHFFSNMPSPIRGGIEGGVSRNRRNTSSPALPLIGGGTLVTDEDLLPLVEATMDRKHPREWFYALMDYGVMLKKQFKNPSRRSAHYVRQSKFEGSNRQLRGIILKAIIIHSPISLSELYTLIDVPKQKVAPIVAQLVIEGFLEKRGTVLLIKQ